MPKGKIKGIPEVVRLNDFGCQTKGPSGGGGGSTFQLSRKGVALTFGDGWMPPDAATQNSEKCVTSTQF